MDARPLALAAGVALAAWLFALVQRDLARLGASWEPRAAAAAAYAAMGAGWAAVLVLSAPTWPAWLGTVAAFLVTVAPRALLRLPRVLSRQGRGSGGAIGRLMFLHGRTSEAKLVAEVSTIRMALSTLTTSSHERAQLRVRARELDTWRGSADPRARELVALMQQAVSERLGDDDASPTEGAHAERGDPRERERRIRELLRELGQ